MGDPMTAMAALSLAANIGQMVEYSIRIDSKSKELRDSLDGSIPENRHKTGWGQVLSSEDERLKDISSACGAIASNLLDELERLRLVSGTKHVRWKSYRQALKTVWGKGKLDHLSHTLETYRNELKTILQISILKRVDVADKRLTGLDQTSQSILEETQTSRKISEANFRELLESIRGLNVLDQGPSYCPVQRLTNGVGGYDLQSPLDHITTFDYDHSGKSDHLVLYRPGSGTIVIAKRDNNGFTLVYNSYAQAAPGSGIGGYDLHSPADRVLAFDYNSSGKLDHLLLYRPRSGAVFIPENKSGVFSPVYKQGAPGAGIGGYDLQSPADRIFAFDYTHSGKLDHLVLYRPGSGAMFILENKSGVFYPVYKQGAPGSGIGGYDLRSPADHAFAFDYTSSERARDVLPRLPNWRPWQWHWGYLIKSPDDRAFAFDFTGSGKADHLAFYRPGAGTFWILGKSEAIFRSVLAEGHPSFESDPGDGIGGFDLLSAADRALSFDHAGSGRADCVLLYRPGTGMVYILQRK